MTRRAEQFGHGCLLGLAAGIHHHDTLRDFGDHAEIVGDQDDRGTDAALQVQHEGRHAAVDVLALRR
mgnify:CR=1 FL=1